ncbi:hypothetical protein LTR69_006876 [Exophiala sideris]|uniref:Major facilitator superfamily (MFS) profile domain-containing protein n=1 Tax=Exophiala sideris TaxID=1016849 RepID=A0ABR0J899_9EURO|nr:hypothetical protein LTR69_006876 [Exophiala sideris]
MCWQQEANEATQISLTAALGSLTYGYAAAVLGNVSAPAHLAQMHSVDKDQQMLICLGNQTLEKAPFYAYMKLDPEGAGLSHADTIIAVWNTILYAGGIIACMACPVIGDRYGRKKVIGLGAVTSVIGAALQAGSVNPAMMIIARLIVGAGMGILLATVPLYQAEIAPPSNRGFIVGIHASLIGFGSMISNWIGVAFYYVPGSAGWRVPLALQVIFPLALVCVLVFIPESPRWLYMHDRADEAEKVLIALHKRADDPTHAFARTEIQIIRSQIDYERANRVPVLEAFKKRSLQKRFALGFLAMWDTQCSGLIVVLAYQAVIYESLGYSPFMAGILGSVWCVLNGTGNFLGGVIGDYVGRKRQIATGLAMLLVLLVLLCVTTKLYAGTDNKSGKTAAAVFTFLMIAVYATGVDCPSLVYSSELYPGEWRALGVATSLSAVLWGCLIFTAAAPAALANIGALYYVVFIVLTFFQLLLVIFFFPDTKGFTLEQMSAVFGDAVVDMHGNVEKAEDFMKEDHDVDHMEISEDIRIEQEAEQKV